MSIFCYEALCLKIPGAQCSVPDFHVGDWYSIEQGKELNTLINEHQLINEVFSGECLDLRRENATIDADGRYHSTVLFYSR